MVVEREGRVNRLGVGAAARAVGWAEAKGMVGTGGLWDRGTFEGRRFGWFASYVHPDAGEEVLDLLTHWFVWLWYVDDALEGMGREEGERFLRGVARRPDATRPAANPAERGADDLWPRTAALVPDAWLRRFRRHVTEVLEAMAAAEVNNHTCRVPNPIEYVDARRAFGGMLFAADLVEPGSDVHLDEDLVAARPLRLLRETFADVVALRNDILSYRKEVPAGEAPSNGVAVVQHFLGCDPVTAARLVADLQQARCQELDRLADHDLPAHCADHDVDDATRVAIGRWVEAIRDWMAGDARWARESGRYTAPEALAAPTALFPRGPTGVGTAAARLT